MKRIWAVVTAAGLLAVPATAEARTIDPAQFGLHVETLGAGVAPQIGVKAVRLWDTGARWDQIEPARGKYNWAPLDRAVDGRDPRRDLSRSLAQGHRAVGDRERALRYPDLNLEAPLPRPVQRPDCEGGEGGEGG